MRGVPFQSRLRKGQDKLENVLGRKHIIGFRDDIDDIWVSHYKDKDWGKNNKILAREANQGLYLARNKLLTFEDGFRKIQILDGITAGAIGTGIFLGLQQIGVEQIPAFIPSIVVFILFFSINSGIVFTKALINIACYEDVSPRQDATRLVFCRAWNRSILRSNSSILGIVVVAITRRMWRERYELGIKFVDSYYENKLSNG